MKIVSVLLTPISVPGHTHATKPGEHLIQRFDYAFFRNVALRSNGSKSYGQTRVKRIEVLRSTEATQEQSLQ